MPWLKLSLLGSPQVEHRGEPLKFDSRKILALVAYLAVTGESHNRESLITLLWPELEPSRARAGLRRNLSVLKKALEGEWLIVDRKTIGTDPSADIGLDVTEFRRLQTVWQSHDHPRNEACSQCLPSLAEAVELYRGEFLEGFSLRDSPNFDEWQFFQTESLRQELAAALESLVNGHTAQGEFKSAVHYARRWLALDPLHEPAHRHLMRLYAWSDQRAAAVRQYGQCERVLEAELGVSPDEETTQLFRAISEKLKLPPGEKRVSAPSATGVLNDRYRLDDELGRGNMGAVHRAHDILLDRDVAVKMFSNTRLGTEGSVRLLEEAQAAARLNHPNIVSVYDAGQADVLELSGQKVSFTVMELVKGEPLYDRHPDEMDAILVIARQVCAALEHAHAHGIVHRDLKPENIIIARDGTAKLTDFGLARPVASRITTDGAIIGTVFYLAPELALGQRFDGRADLYALGVILYELTTGRLPFIADDAMAVIAQHLHAPLVPPRARNAEIPPALDALIVRLMSKDPDNRPASATEVLRLLSSPHKLDQAANLLEEATALTRIGGGQLVGREDELELANDLWSRTLSGQGQMLLLSGEAGIGKTRLVRELTTHVRVSGGRAYVGACYAEGGVPYAPFSQILHRSAKNEDGQESDIHESMLADLVTIAPSLRLNYPNVQPLPDDPESKQLRMFDSLVIFFNTISNRAPLLLIVEDIHWADSGTLTLLRHLARHTRLGRVMIVATNRPVEPEDARVLHEMLLDLNREKLATRVELPRLDREQTRQMLAVLFTEEITPSFLDGIYRETEGNPFFVEELCKALIESGKMIFSDGRWQRPSMKELGIPQSVEVAIQSRVRVLPVETQDILCLAAVLGRDFEFDTLMKACMPALSGTRAEEALVEALDNAERAQLIREVSSEGGGTYSFVHALIPTTLVESIRSLKRRRLHRQAASAIESRNPDDFEALAHHYTLAGNLEKAADYLLQAGDRARGLYAHLEAINSYQKAQEYLKKVGKLEQVARTQMKLGLTYHNAFDFKAARRAYQEAFILGQQMAEIDSAGELPNPPHALRITAFEPTTLDPSAAMDLPSHVMIDQLFSGLVEVSSEMDIVPDVAHSWEVQEGGRRYIFHLRDDVLWSDGIQVTASDFEYAWKHTRPYPSQERGVKYMYFLLGTKAYREDMLTDTELIGVRSLDDFTLVADLEEPISYLPYLLSFVPTFPVPQHVVESYGMAWADLDKLVTNGPFKLAGWEQGEGLVMERNPTYHGRFPGNLGRVECTFSSGQSDRVLQMYEKDRLDICYGLSLTEWNQARHRYAGEYVSGPWLSTDFIGFDVSRPPFSDSRVRRALALATDRESLAHLTLRGYAFPATGGLVPPEMPGHSPDIGLPYDPEAARHLLAEAGYPGGRGFPTVFCLVRDDPGHDLMSDYLHGQWLESLGIEISWMESTWAEFPDKMSVDAPQLWMAGWYADYPDPDDFLRIQWWISPAWRNNDFDQLVEGAGRSMDQEDRMNKYREADKLLVEEAPILPLCYGRFHMLAKPWVRKYFMSPLKWWSWKDVILEPH
jgi:ABC-type transport system substrate-binding protein/DNA-binding SARP family transcriptional activator/MoxR-like ATPase